MATDIPRVDYNQHAPGCSPRRLCSGDLCKADPDGPTEIDRKNEYCRRCYQHHLVKDAGLESLITRRQPKLRKIRAEDLRGALPTAPAVETNRPSGVYQVFQQQSNPREPRPHRPNKQQSKMVLSCPVGTRRGKLVILEHTNPTHWTCRCDCGVERLFNASEIYRGRTSSCGCARKVNNGSLNLELILERRRIRTAARMEEREKLKVGDRIWVKGQLVEVRAITEKQQCLYYENGKKRYIDRRKTRLEAWGASDKQALGEDANDGN